MALSEVYPPKSEQDTLPSIIMAVPYLIKINLIKLSLFRLLKPLTKRKEEK